MSKRPRPPGDHFRASDGIGSGFGVDRYGWTVAEVVLPDGKSLNRELVRDGFAWWYEKYAPGDTALRDLQTEARTARRGLWADPSPTPPWDWRAGKGAATTAKIVGNRNSHLYHAGNCNAAAKILDKNRVEFATVKEAEAGGYRAAKDCGVGE